MTQVGLARERFEDGRRTYEANRAGPYARAIQQLVRRQAEPKPTQPAAGARDTADDALRSALVAHGAALWGAPMADSAERSLEEVVVQACDLARRDPTVARILPALLVRQRDALDLSRLQRAVAKHGHKHETGLFLALAAELSDDQTLAAWAEELRDKRRVKTQDFFASATSPRLQRLAERNTPAVARAWHFRLNMPLEAFRTTLERAE